LGREHPALREKSLRNNRRTPKLCVLGRVADPSVVSAPESATTAKPLPAAALPLSRSRDVQEATVHAAAYRPDIDGLRAVAVLFVLVFHASPNSLRGGFIGVDIFFVISGYLISSILFRSLQTGQFSYVDFYARRIRRIFPALVLVLGGTMLAGSLLLFPDELRQLGKHVVAGALFVSNLLLYTESGYFDAAAETKPLLHLWSLGIEEQFYILWPIVLALLWRRRALIPWAIAGMALLSFAANVGTAVERPSFAFYMPITRFWELLIGCMAAYFAVVHAHPSSSTPRLPKICYDAGSVLGLMLIIAAVTLLSSASTFPGWWALLPTLGTVLLIATGPGAFVNRRILSQRLMVSIGLVSYPLYLWHWPVLLFWQDAAGATLTRWDKLGALALSVALAFATYRLVERPLRFGPHPRRAAIGLSTGMAIVVIAGLVLHAGTFGGQYRDRQDFLAHFENSPPEHGYLVRQDLERKFRLDCNFYDRSTKGPKASIPADCYVHSKPFSVLLWGDSHAQHLRHGLERQLPPDVSLMQVATAGCAPSLTDRQPDHLGSCNRSNRFALDLITSGKPYTVLIAQGARHDRTDWVEFAAELRRQGVHQVVLVGPVPKWKPDLHRVVARNYWPTPPRELRSHLDTRTIETDRLLAARYRDAAGLRYLSAIAVLCPGQGCLTYLGDDVKTGLITWDYGHLTPDSSLYLGERLFGGHRLRFRP
jgi:peptidoglycan/LPS O-acetylase OafA/YrhL